MQTPKRSSSTSQVYQAEHLPNDVDLLKQMVRSLLDDIRQKDRQALDLQSQLEVLKRRLFGRRSETLDPAQLALFEGLIEQVARTRAARSHRSIS